MGKEKRKKLVILSKYQIIHNAYCDLTALLRSIAGFFGEYQYDFIENGISEKPTDIGSEVKSEWMASREVTDYVKYNMTVVVLARDIRKVKLQSGEELYWARLMIHISTDADKNYNETFGSGHWGEMTRQIYERFVVNRDMSKYKVKLYHESMELIDRIKAHLK